MERHGAAPRRTTQRVVRHGTSPMSLPPAAAAPDPAPAPAAPAPPLPLPPFAKRWPSATDALRCDVAPRYSPPFGAWFGDVSPQPTASPYVLRLTFTLTSTEQVRHATGNRASQRSPAFASSAQTGADDAALTHRLPLICLWIRTTLHLLRMRCCRGWTCVCTGGLWRSRIGGCSPCHDRLHSTECPVRATLARKALLCASRGGGPPLEPCVCNTAETGNTPRCSPCVGQRLDGLSALGRPTRPCSQRCVRCVWRWLQAAGHLGDAK